MSRTTTDVVMSDLKPTHSVQLSQLDAEELVRNFIGVERRLRCPQFPHCTTASSNQYSWLQFSQKSSGRKGLNGIFLYPTVGMT